MLASFVSQRVSGGMSKSKKGKKERVIHTRISEALEQELKTRASGLGMSVSNLVRNALLSTFGAVEGMARDGAALTRSVTFRHEPPGRADIGAAVDPAHGNRNVVGWQTLLLAVNAVCAKCNAIMTRGDEAAIGVMSTPAEPRPLLCLACLDALRTSSPS